MVKWIIDKIEDNPQVLRDAIEACGYEVKYIEYIPFLSHTEYTKDLYDKNDCVIPYTTINLGRYINYYYGSCLDYDSFLFSNYYSAFKIENHKWLNNDFIMLPFYEVVIGYDRIRKYMNSNAFFMRPNSGFKLFTGLPIESESHLQSEVNSLRHLSGVDENSLIIISSLKNIKQEYRFIIVGGEIIDGSLYNYEGSHIEHNGWPHEAKELAEEVAKKSIEIDNPYYRLITCDIAHLDDGSFKIIEINCLNSSGWYACDKEKVIIGVSNYIEKMYNKDREEGLI